MTNTNVGAEFTCSYTFASSRHMFKIVLDPKKIEVEVIQKFSAFSEEINAKRE